MITITIVELIDLTRPLYIRALIPKIGALPFGDLLSEEILTVIVSLCSIDLARLGVFIAVFAQ